MFELIQGPWHWAVAGLLIGLTVPALLIVGNKTFGLSSNLRHICAACMPANIPFFKYDWKKEIWNLYLLAGIVLGGLVGTYLIGNPNPIQVHPDLAKELATYGLEVRQSLLPAEIFSFGALFSLRGLVFMVFGGFLVGFGTRYAGGCTSGHAIMGLSNLQLPSLIATICFMAGGLLAANFLLPFLLRL